MKSDPDLIARIVAAIAERTDAQGAVLAAALAARWSPPDRHDPLALEWLRRRDPGPAHFPTAGVLLRGRPVPRL